MSCGARNFLSDDNSIELSSFKNLNVDNTGYSDVKLNLKLLNKYFEVHTLEENLVQRRNDFQTRTEHLQKRKGALHEKEIMFKEKIISYEMYIKELAMKRDRSLRRIDDERNFIKNKRIEIAALEKDIERMHEEKTKLQTMIALYQPHLNLLTQIVDQTDRFHSIDEMIEKFDMLYASYQDILATIKNSNEELNDVQRQLLLTTEKKNNKISYMNTRIHGLQQQQLEIQQRIDKIQTEIGNYQQISKERLTEIGAIKIAIESMFDLAARYSHRNRKQDLHLDEYMLIKLKQIDTFLSDLIYYVDYVNNKQNKFVQQNHQPIGDDHIKSKQENVLDKITNDIVDNNRWRGPCETDRREILVEKMNNSDQSPYFSYKVYGEDNRFYTIQVKNIDKTNAVPARNSLTPNRSSISMVSRSKKKKSSSIKIQKSNDTQSRSPTTQSTRTTMKLIHHPSINDAMPFSHSELADRTSIRTNDK